MQPVFTTLVEKNTTTNRPSNAASTGRTSAANTYADTTLWKLASKPSMAGYKSVCLAGNRHRL